MREISAQGLQLIRHFEGFSAVPYRCPAGYWTIGYGHAMTAQDRASLTVLDEVQALALLRYDTRITEKTVARLIRVPLQPYQFDALASFVFNLGGAALQRSRLRRAVNRGEQGAVPAEFMRWVWADGRRLAGLVRRRAAEARLYQGLTGFERAISSNCHKTEAIECYSGNSRNTGALDGD